LGVQPRHATKARAYAVIRRFPALKH